MPTPADELALAMADAWNAGRPDRIIALAPEALAVAAESEPVLAFLGLAQQQVGLHAAAAETFERLSRLRPDVSEYWNNLGVARRQSGDFGGSERALLEARALASRDADVCYNLGLLYIQQQRWAAARESLVDAVRLAPGLVEARVEAAHACHVCGDVETEEAMLEGAGDWPPQPAAQALILASILSVLGQLDIGLEVLARARVPEGSTAASMQLRIAAQRVALYERSNMLEHAQRELQTLPLSAVETLDPDDADARIDIWRAHAVMASREHRHRDAAGLYRRVLDLARDPEVVSSAAFGLALACDRQMQYRDAWNALDIAHASQMEIARAAAPELSASSDRPLPMVTRTVAAPVSWKPLRAPSMQKSPVFVVGFPRSGTTLLEQMLDAHPDFSSMDERGYVYQLIERLEHAGQRYPDDLAELNQDEADQLRAIYGRLAGRTLPELGQRRLVDKNPLNMLCLPMILRLFPDARIVLCLRHPCDVLLSCSMQPFRSPAFRLMCSSLPRLARGYADAFMHCSRHIEVLKPSVLEWHYESVVQDFDGAVKRLGQFLDVADTSPFSEFAARASAKRFIATPSYAQVTQPVNSAAVGRWMNYREHFEPVLPILRPWLERFGYA